MTTTTTTSDPATSEVTPVVRRFIEDAGNATQSFGFGRVLGQVYSYLYFSQEPRNLAQMQDALGISKGSASTNVRQLEQWSAVKKVWVKGDRKDYYESNDWFGNILKNALSDIVGKRMSAYTALLDEVDSEMLDLSTENGGAEFVRERVEHIRDFYKKAQGTWDSPVVKMLLK